jgi:hypothetical protein
MAEPERRIIITALGEGFRVEIQPPVEGEHLDANLPDYRRARGWAGGLRFTRGWRIHDQAEARA